MQSLQEYLIAELKGPYAIILNLDGNTSDAIAFWNSAYLQYITALADKLSAAEPSTWNTAIDEFLNTENILKLNGTWVPEPEVSRNPANYLQVFNEQVFKASIAPRVHAICTACLVKPELQASRNPTEIQLF